MTNFELLEKNFPVAPLKIAALDSCKELGKKVNDYIVEFRKNVPKEAISAPLFSKYQEEN